MGASLPHMRPPKWKSLAALLARSLTGQKGPRATRKGVLRTSPPPSPLAIGGASGDSGHRPNFKSSEAEGPGRGVHSLGHQDPGFSRPPARPARGQLAAAAPFSSRPEFAWRAQYQLPELPAAGTPTAPDAVPSSKTGGLGDERATVASHSPRR